MKPSAPKLLLALSAPGTRHPYEFEHSWAIGMFHATWLNLAVCITMLTPSTLTGVVEAASTLHILGIVFFSVLWGIGIVHPHYLLL